MRKHPEVIAILFLALVWGVASQLPAPGSRNRVMVLTNPGHSGVAVLRDCPTDRVRMLTEEMRERLRADMRDRVREEMRFALQELRNTLHSLK